MSKKVEITQETEAKMKEIRGKWLAQWEAKNGTSKVRSWMNDPVKLRIINAMAYLEATGQ